MIIKFEMIRKLFDSGLALEDSYCLFPSSTILYKIEGTDIKVIVCRAGNYLGVSFIFGDYRIDFDINYFYDYNKQDKPATMCVDWYRCDDVSDVSGGRCQFSQDIFNTFSDKSKLFYMKNIDFFSRRKLKDIDIFNEVCLNDKT